MASPVLSPVVAEDAGESSAGSTASTVRSPSTLTESAKAPVTQVGCGGKEDAIVIDLDDEV